DAPPAPGYAGHEPGGRHPSGYADDAGDDTGYGYGTGYHPDGYQETDYHPGYDDTSTGFPVTGDVLAMGAGGAATDGFTDTSTGFPVTGDVLPAGAGGFADTGAGFTDTGTGYVDPAYGDDRYSDDEHRYPGDGGYQAGDGGYPGYDGPAAGRRDRNDDHDYPDTGSWYGDVDEQRGWAEDDSGFLPGLGQADPDDDVRQAERGGPGRGRGPGGAGPGKQKTGKTRAGQARGGKPKSRMRRVAPWLALSVVVALLIGAGGGYYYVYSHYLHPPDFSGAGTSTAVVRIYPGDTASVVGERLQKLGVVASARAFSNAAKVSGNGTALEPGYYRVHLHMSAALAFALLLKPSSREQTKITIPEGWRLSEIIATLGRATGNPAGYQQAIKDVSALGLPSFARGNPEGYLFPATYDVQPNTPPIKVLQGMVTRFGQEAASVSLPAAAAHAELTQAEVIIVASLIQAEGRPADFPKVARVIYNRLNANPPIKLQLDSTVMYALHTHGVRATSQQIKVKSLYNTYLHAGLPPGPIDSPGDAAIRAALHPAQGNWMYFVTVDPKTGETKFTSSFAQFQRYEAELTANLAKGR
ncbi:MAG TPA: endolytic transglycosylase MltG, partial [Streptosporangiaceae bacterium]|nr:endolytic transglycosylase MltG [Streptosporangiaceae bacterium]